jgi:altronate hydrolase
MTREKPIAIRLSPDDNIAVALNELSPGTALDMDNVVCQEKIPAGHKVAILKINTSEPIRKYGQVIGFASSTLEPGRHVHTHNVQILEFARDYAIGQDKRPTDFVPENDRASFYGIVRPDCQVATRNYVGVLSSANCSASVTRFIADSFPPDILAEFPNVDGVVAIGHGTGCGMGSDGEGFRLLQRTLAGYARHPNFAGILLVGLGCEVNYIDCLIGNMGLKRGRSLRTIEIQDSGGTRETVGRGVEAVREMLSEANQAIRTPLDASRIILGLECGGSDAFSGISANPALGAAVDLLVRNGGTAILSETPEVYGAEHLLTRRAESPEVAEKLIRLIRWWEQYTRALGGKIDNNPSPGNKAGGLTTILEKSLGASSKGGNTNLVDVYSYAEPVLTKGLVFMDTPGYDPVSITGMIAGRANVICFTTGRGSVSGFKPVPSIKLASNTEMYQRLSDDMDVNCGRIVDGDASVQEMGEVIFRLILETASGKKTKSEELGLGDNEFVPWQIGPVM